ncbi:MAG: hypothetical protein H6Q69_2245 [Firmicutes bacterium]|nr:hypothetical protein [Bacillota bacterium]
MRRNAKDTKYCGHFILPILRVFAVQKFFILSIFSLWFHSVLNYNMHKRLEFLDLAAYAYYNLYFFSTTIRGYPMANTIIASLNPMDNIVNQKGIAYNIER